MAGRIAVRSCFQPRLQGVMAKFRGSITFLVRNKSSFAKPQENRMRIGDIRGLCETPEVHEISHLFEKVYDLPEKHLVTSACSSALYWLLYSDKIEEAFEFKNLMDKYGIPKTYSTYSSLAILYAKRGRYLENMKELFNEMAKDGLSPRSRHYAPFVEAAVEEGDLLSAFNSLNEMERSAVVYEQNLDLYILLIKACARSQNRKLTNKVLKIFSDFGKYRDSLSMDVLEAVKLWFDRFHCQVCQQKLETGAFSAAELEEFKLPLVNLLWKNNQLLRPVECFTSAGKYKDCFSQGQQNNFPQSIEQFITATGPYDIVIDGLNVAYFKGFFDPGKVEDMVVYFVRQRKRVLVLGCSPMKLLPRIQGNLQTPLDKLMDYLVNHEQCGVFCLKESSIDDVYLISAGMHCGPGARLVSCDRFFNHISRMDPLMKAQFRRWQNLNQMVLEKFVGSEPVFVNNKLFDSAVQSTGDAWHFPASDGIRWLCARKTGFFK